MRMNSPGGRLLIGVGVIAAVGIALSIAAGWRSIDVIQADPALAAAVFEEARREAGTPEPVLALQDGGYVRRPVPPQTPPRPSTLVVLVYHRPSARLARVEVAFWFLRMKGPASELALSGAGIDLEDLGLTVDDLERYGPTLVLDEQRGDNRVLLWTR